jgi:hypothetical protein
MDSAQPEVAGVLIARALEEGDDSPRVQVLASRLAIANGMPDDALVAAERALADATAANDSEARCAALDVQARALD